MTAIVLALLLAQVNPADWTGTYRQTGVNVSNNTIVPNVLPPDAHLIGEDLDKLIPQHMQPWALAKQEATDLEEGDTGIICKLTGPFRQFTTGGFTIIPTPGKLTFVLNSVEVGGVRRVYLNQNHPGNLRPTWNGHSVGHWEGDTLIVDTVGYNDKSWLYSDRWPHTEAMHVVERMRMIAGGTFLEIFTTVEDPKALTTPYTFSRYYRRVNAEPAENVCNQDPLLWLEIYKGPKP
jgi:hypothetical protein